MAVTVVSNSSPIIHLAKIDHLDLLQEFFGEILIPNAVHQECVTPGRERPEVTRITAAAWLKVMDVANRNLVKLLRSEIDRGEAEAIALALETRADLILLDDFDARQKARLYGMNITGVLGIVLRASKSGRINSMATTLDKLEKTGFWLNPDLRRRLLLAVE